MPEPWVYVLALVSIGVMASVPGWLVVRRQMNGAGVPAVLSERERNKMAARIYDLENEVTALHEKLVTFDALKANIDALTLENLKLRREVDGLRTEVDQLNRENRALRKV